MINDNKIIVNFSKYSHYESFSDGYYWMSYESTLAIIKETNEKNLNDALNSPLVWDSIGRNLFNMPYMDIGEGVYDFIIPVYSDSSSEDVKRQSIIGDIVKALIQEPEIDLFFSNKTKFILYNDEIVIEYIEDEDDANIVNIAYNIISLFLLQKLRRGYANE